jgi:hypothetical protein
VSTTDLAPVHTKASIGCLGNEGNLFSQIKVGVFSTIASFDLDEGDIAVLRSQTSLVAQNGTVHVQTR